jgi:hypothetical protein
MRLNRLGAKLITVFFLVGAALLGLGIYVASGSTLDLLGAIMLIGMGGAYVLASLAAVWVALRVRFANRHKRWLAANGLRGKATIVFAATEMSINEQPVFELVVDLDVPGQAPRRIERKLIVGSFAARRMRPGLTMPAYVHPRDPDDVLLVW